MSPANTDPFFLEATGRGAGAAAALLLHGFTGTPYEMRGLGEALAENGIAAKGIRLPGHESCAHMTGVRRRHWRAEVRSEFLDLRSRYPKVGLVGLSTGALLSLDLAASPSIHVDALASLAAPMFLYGWRAKYLLPFLARTPLRHRMKWHKTSPGNIRDPEARDAHPSLRWCTIDALDELRLLIKEVRKKLPAVKAPLLIEHARHDSTALVRSAEILYGSVGSAIRQKVILPDSYHIITVDVEREQVIGDVVRFMRTWLLRAAPTLST